MQKIHTPQGKKIVASIVGLCHELGLKVLAMGVENEHQAQQFKQFGCEYAAGFYFYYPVDSGEFEKLILSGAGENFTAVY